MYVIVTYCCFFCFKQKTAYEMRISDCSSDVCSSDLLKDVKAYGLRAEVCLSYACARPEEICLTPSAAEGPFGQRRAPPGDSPLDRLERGGSKVCNCEDAVRLELLGVEEGVCDCLAIPSHQGASGILVALNLAYMDLTGREDRCGQIGRAHVCTPVTNAQPVC